MNDDIRKYRAIINESYVLDSQSNEIDALIDSIRRLDENPAAAVIPAAVGTIGRVAVGRMIQGAVPRLAPRIASWLSRGAGAAAGRVPSAATSAGTRKAADMFSKGAGPLGIGAAGGTAAQKGAGIAGIAGGGATAFKKYAKKGVKKIGKEMIEDAVEAFLSTPPGQKMENASPQTLQGTTERVLVQNGCEPEAADGFLDVLKRSGLFAGGAMTLFILFLIISYLIANPQAIQQIAGAFGGETAQAGAVPK